MSDSNEYIQQIEDTLGASRFFYGLRRTDQGELYLGKVDLMNTNSSDALQINLPGNPNENLPSFTRGVDFLEGRDVEHTKVYENLNYEQFRWDSRNILYYIDSEGQLTLRVNEPYTLSGRNIICQNLKLNAYVLDGEAIGLAPLSTSKMMWLDLVQKFMCVK